MKISINKQKISSILESVMSGSPAPIAGVNGSNYPNQTDIYPNSKKYKKVGTIVENAGINGLPVNIKKNPSDTTSIQDHSSHLTQNRMNNSNSKAPGSDIQPQKTFQSDPNIPMHVKAAGLNATHKLLPKG